MTSKLKPLDAVPKSTPTEHRWSITQLRKTATRLGSAYAPDEQSALLDNR